MSSMANYQQQEASDADEGRYEFYKGLDDTEAKRIRDVTPFITGKMVESIVSEFHIHKDNRPKVVKFVTTLPVVTLISRNYILRDYYTPKDYEEHFKLDLNKATNFAILRWKESMQPRSILGDVELTDFSKTRGLRRARG